ncbi:MAG: hypothetical protein WBO19_21970 [Terriglobia bacterium]|jgi:hypothetical protein
MAADSASALNISLQPGTIAGVVNVYDNANKVFNLYKGRPIGCVTFGAGSIGNSSMGTLIKDLRAALMDKAKAEKLHIDFDPDNYTMESVSTIVAKFLEDECKKQSPPVLLGMNIGIFLGGYSTGGKLGEGWSIDIKQGKGSKPKLMRPPDQPGITWGGMSEVLQRIILGFSPLIFQVLSEVSGTQGKPQTSPQELFNQLNALLVSKMQAPLVFAPMPIQDAIDLGRFLVYAAIMYSRFLPGAQVVGGPIEIAAITKHEGFKWISRKYYYDHSLNWEQKNDPINQPKQG